MKGIASSHPSPSQRISAACLQQGTMPSGDTQPQATGPPDIARNNCLGSAKEQSTFAKCLGWCSKGLPKEEALIPPWPGGCLLGCHNKIPSINRSSNNRHLFFPVWEARSLRLGWLRFGPVEGCLPGLQMSPSHGVPTWPFLGVHNGAISCFLFW
jgi:hypothetical protein